jgi:hypothetical protein
MDGTGRILGSLRKASFNRAALCAAQELVPADATLEIFDLDSIPPFNEDDERTLPARVVGAEIETETKRASRSVPAIAPAMASPATTSGRKAATTEPKTSRSSAATRGRMIG